MTRALAGASCAALIVVAHLVTTDARAARASQASQVAQPSPSPPGGQIPTFGTRVDAVRVDVLVTEGGKPVRDLRVEDFEILDNGVPQQVDSASFEQVPLNVVLVLDMSRSVRGPMLSHLRTAGASLLNVLEPADQAALITFGDAVRLRQRLTADRALVQAALERTEDSANTALVDAAFAGMLVGESDVGRALVIVFSDGLETSSWLSAPAVLQAARRADVVVYAVSASTTATDPFLDDLVELTGGASYRVASTQGLGQAFTRVLHEFRQRYLLGYSPRGVSPNGWHRLEVKVKGRRVAVKARPGYLAGVGEPR